MLPDEKATIEALAASVNESASSYFRLVGLNLQPRSMIDLEQAREPVRINGEAAGRDAREDQRKPQQGTSDRKQGSRMWTIGGINRRRRRDNDGQAMEGNREQPLPQR
ncbi:hypothetical protein [Sphingomonas sp. S-NIH.Pt15_0812]|uniref:hypothetical protein n=1 Tax=Sphingomonas sp. S-NIH.Pt15_0812 TaxID=1920129 RepID=UPI000F7E1EEB|nr:hypothetical protein [Sphingomonas sp. S-NIH.Pt15_0812]